MRKHNNDEENPCSELLRADARVGFLQQPCKVGPEKLCMYLYIYIYTYVYIYIYLYSYTVDKCIYMISVIMGLFLD